MNPYKVTGSFMMGSAWQPFAKELLAKNNEDARERLYCIIGSKHRTPRRLIQIETIEELAPDEVTDVDVLNRLEE